MSEQKIDPFDMGSTILPLPAGETKKPDSHEDALSPEDFASSDADTKAEQTAMAKKPKYVLPTM